MSYWAPETGHTWPSDLPIADDRCQTCGCTYGTQGKYQCATPDQVVLAVDGDDQGSRQLVTTGQQPQLQGHERTGPDYARHAGSGHQPVTVVSLLHSRAEARWAEIEKFLRSMFEHDIASMREKSLAYGASDLEIMAKANERLLPGSDRLSPDRRSQAGMEMAIGHYLLGKASRLYGAWENGIAPSDDTWYDAYVYAMMGRVVRHTGRWM